MFAYLGIDITKRMKNRLCFENHLLFFMWFGEYNIMLSVGTLKLAPEVPSSEFYYKDPYNQDTSK